MTHEEPAFADTERTERARALLPAWFIPRMMEDAWSFAFLMVSGTYIHVEHIAAVHESADGLWLDVDLCTDQPRAFGHPAGVVAPTSRTTASIAVRHIMLAFETADT
jgi:hypothetical protein